MLHRHVVSLPKIGKQRVSTPEYIMQCCMEINPPKQIGNGRRKWQVQPKTTIACKASLKVKLKIKGSKELLTRTSRTRQQTSFSETKSHSAHFLKPAEHVRSDV